MRNNKITTKIKKTPTASRRKSNRTETLVKNQGAPAGMPLFLHQSGIPLRSHVSRAVGGIYGRDFSDVRVHTNDKAAGLADRIQAQAVTIGNDIAFARGAYRPGTPAGDGLIAHELAHVAQQQTNGGNEGIDTQPPGLLEKEADMAAMGAVSKMFGNLRTLLGEIYLNAVPRLKTGLKLQRCIKSCTDEEVSLLQRLSDIDSAYSLAGELSDLSTSDLQRLRDEAPSGSLLVLGAEWELAVRERDWATIAGMHRRDQHEFYMAYQDTVIDSIMQGNTSIRVDETAPEFANWADSQFRLLASRPVGFRLVVELLATGQSIRLESTEGETGVEADVDPENPAAGRLITSNTEGGQLQPEQHRSGEPIGSTVRINYSQLSESSVLTGTEQQPEITESPEEITLGHELIHALHYARGQSLSPSKAQGLFGDMFGTLQPIDPATGLPTKPEELLTITGQTGFTLRGQGGLFEGQTMETTYGIPQEDIITENMLREEHGLPLRISHFGASRTAHYIRLRRGTSLDQVMSGYYLEGGEGIPAALRSGIRTVLTDWYPFFGEGNAMPMDWDLRVPTAAYMMLYFNTLGQNPDMAQTAERLRYRGAE